MPIVSAVVLFYKDRRLTFLDLNNIYFSRAASHTLPGRAESQCPLVLLLNADAAKVVRLIVGTSELNQESSFRIASAALNLVGHPGTFLQPSACLTGARRFTSKLSFAQGFSPETTGSSIHLPIFASAWAARRNRLTVR